MTKDKSKSDVDKRIEEILEGLDDSAFEVDSTEDFKALIRVARTPQEIKEALNKYDIRDIKTTKYLTEATNAVVDAISAIHSGKSLDECKEAARKYADFF